MMRTISLRLDDELDAMLRALCERLDATQTDVVRKALELLATTATPSPGALGLELRLVGAFESGGRGDAAGHSTSLKVRLRERRRDERAVDSSDGSLHDTHRGKRKPRAPNR